MDFPLAFCLETFTTISVLLTYKHCPEYCLCYTIDRPCSHTKDPVSQRGISISARVADDVDVSEPTHLPNRIPSIILVMIKVRRMGV